MKVKEKYRFAVTVILIIVIISIPIILQILWYAPYRYCEKCLLSNKDYFEILPKYIKKYELNGDILLNNETTPKEVRNILDKLNKQYQKDSDYPVFTAIEVRCDKNDNIAVLLNAKKEKIENSDGIGTPDVRCYSLVYVEPNYTGEIFAKDEVPFYDNWRTWSSDTYSG